jgi:type III restriction enzyme
MADDKYLYEILKGKAYDLGIAKPKIPDYITENIRYDLYKWQEEALINFLTYQAIREAEEEINPTHLLFNMATGTGKTLLMAALILYYYKQGKRHFIFFVNQNNIVGKTEDNLTDPTHNKYLFKKTIVIDEKTINIQKVNNFSDDTDDIQILFTSIQKLHNDIHIVKEDSIFLEDLQKRDIIMLGDEAHHLNATTKKNNGQKELDLKTELSDNASQADIEKSWENTVIKLILNKGKEKQDELNENALLEFTATVPTNKEVVKKYIDKTIYKFDLKDFLKAGYTKEINLVSSSFDKKRRILQALLFNWYRHKIALDHGLVNFKPVILFRSKFIDKAKENNSEEDFKYFIDLINRVC